MDKFSTLIFIGNGFDLAAHYETSFADFYQSIYFEKLIKDGNKLAKHINDVNNDYQQEGIQKWADLEEELYRYAHWLEEEDEPDKTLESHFLMLKQALFMFIDNAVKQHTEFPIPLCKIIEQWKKEDENTCFITFNYTHILEGLCTDFVKFSPQIRYVHGDATIGSISDPHIVLGIDESKKILDYYDFLYKSSDTDNYNNYDVTELVTTAKRIIIFGCAMGESDNWYFEQVFKNCIGKSVEINAYQKKSFQYYNQRIKNLSKKSLADFQTSTKLKIFDCSNLNILLINRERYYKEEHPEILESLK